MNIFPESLEAVISHFEKLPGIGRKSAERIGFYILTLPKDEVKEFADSLLNVITKIKPCKECNNITDTELCKICQDPKRDKKIVCVVEEPKDIIAIERTQDFKGVYHVLLGSISPLEGKGPSNLALAQLLKKIEKNEVEEVIIATDSDSEGQATALYLLELLKNKNVKRITRLGLGVPMGADLELVDLASLKEALKNRRVLSERKA